MINPCAWRASFPAVANDIYLLTIFAFVFFASPVKFAHAELDISGDGCIIDTSTGECFVVDSNYLVVDDGTSNTPSCTTLLGDISALYSNIGTTDSGSLCLSTGALPGDFQVPDIVTFGDEEFFAESNKRARAVIQYGGEEWSKLETAARDIVAAQMNVANNDRLRQAAGDDIRAVMFLVILNKLKEGQLSLANQTLAELSDNPEAIQYLILADELEAHIKTFKLAVAQMARGEFNEWKQAPCFYSPPVGDPDAYRNRDDVQKVCESRDLSTTLTSAPPPSALEFYQWAAEVKWAQRYLEWNEIYRDVSFTQYFDNELEDMYAELIRTTMLAVPYQIARGSSEFSELPFDLTGASDPSLANSVALGLSEGLSEGFLANYLRDFLTTQLILMSLSPDPHDLIVIASFSLAIETLKVAGIAEIEDTLNRAVNEAQSFDIYNAINTEEGRTDILLGLASMAFPDHFAYRKYLAGTLPSLPSQASERFELMDDYRNSLGLQNAVTVTDPFKQHKYDSDIIGINANHAAKEYYLADSWLALQNDSEENHYNVLGLQGFLQWNNVFSANLNYQNWEQEFWIARRVGNGFLHLRYASPIANQVFVEPYNPSQEGCASPGSVDPNYASLTTYSCFNVSWFTGTVVAGDILRIGFLTTKVRSVNEIAGVIRSFVIEDEIPEEYRDTSLTIHKFDQDYRNCQATGLCYFSDEIRFENKSRKVDNGYTAQILRVYQDADRDGIEDSEDNCPGLANPDQSDLDSDGQGDACDSDKDGDGVANLVDNCPSIANADQNDLDSDGQGDACDSDKDGDGVANLADNCPLIANADQNDLDSDGQGDACDSDKDGDGVANIADNCPLIANSDQNDLDSDGQGDACDSDVDGDGVANLADNCPLIANADQNDLDSDGRGDACDSDKDGDGVANLADNCPLIINPNQVDFDGDGKGDVCDSDIDGDNVINSSDQCAFTALGDTANPTNGCSIAQLCPCDDMSETLEVWKKGGEYTSCTAKVTKDFERLGLITKEQRIDLIGQAAQSACGK